MDDLTLIEEYYQKYIKNLAFWLPEGLIDVNLALLQRFNLLNFHENDEEEPALTRYFHVIESHEKIMLVSDQFIIWIVPEKTEDSSLTYVLVALNTGGEPRLELCFTTSGVYNTSRLVLRILEKFLIEIQENEELLQRFSNE